eukprot:snap_masked-scaffold_77-processed-gene-0.25-mRNA-1 protein AED:1.00 eAED:1.00 QI:0/0/0/0/1/1/2/0/64
MFITSNMTCQSRVQQSFNTQIPESAVAWILKFKWYGVVSSSSSDGVKDGSRFDSSISLWSHVSS